MKKYFISSDIHSFYDEWQTALKEVGFDINNPDHIIVVCGDLLDRGPKPYQCLKFVNSLSDDRKILIRGNHEDLIQKAIDNHELTYVDDINGTTTTIMDLAEEYEYVSDALDKIVENSEFIKYIDSLVDYYEIGNSIFVHGWIPCDVKYRNNKPIYSMTDNWKSGNWNKARWINGMEAWNNGIKIDGKTIYCGHWHTSWGHKYLHKLGPEWNNLNSTNPALRYANFNPFMDNGIIALDACTAYSHKINIIVKDEDDL